MAKVRWFLELFYIANIDADYLRRFNDKCLSDVFWYMYYQWFFITTYLTSISEQPKNNENFLFRSNKPFSDHLSNN